MHGWFVVLFNICPSHSRNKTLGLCCKSNYTFREKRGGIICRCSSDCSSNIIFQVSLRIPLAFAPQKFLWTFFFHPHREINIQGPATWISFTATDNNTLVGILKGRLIPKLLASQARKGHHSTLYLQKEQIEVFLTFCSSKFIVKYPRLLHRKTMLSSTYSVNGRLHYL